MRVNSSSFLLYILLVKVMLLSWKVNTAELLESLKLKNLRMKYFESKDSNILKRIGVFYKADNIKQINLNKASNNLKLLSSFQYEEKILPVNATATNNGTSCDCAVITGPKKCLDRSGCGDGDVTFISGRRILFTSDSKNSYNLI